MFQKLKMCKNDPPFRVYLFNFVYLFIEKIGFYASFMLQYVFMFQKHTGWCHLNKIYHLIDIYVLRTFVTYFGGVGYTQTLKKSKQDIIYQDEGF